MAALRDIARDFADEIRDGIGWVIIYRTGRSWHGVTVWSDVASDEWETDDINEALDVLKVDPKAVLLNGYYCGHFAEDMTIDQIAAGIIIRGTTRTATTSSPTTTSSAASWTASRRPGSGPPRPDSPSATGWPTAPRTRSTPTSTTAA